MQQPRICAITGANSGLGKVTALELAKQGFDIIMICRDADRSRRQQAEIRAASLTGRVDLIECDLGNMDDIHRASEEMHSRYDRLDILINNAGRVVDTLQYSPEGIELTFQTNYLSHFLLTHLVLDLLRKSDEARIINVASELHRLAQFDMSHIVRRDKAPYRAIPAYDDSKLAKLLWTFELADQLMDDGITVNALHPWLVDTAFGNSEDASGLLNFAFWFFKLFAPKPETAARTHIYLASSPEVRHVTGLYFANCKPYPPSDKALDRSLGKQVWALSERLTGIYDYLRRPLLRESGLPLVSGG